MASYRVCLWESKVGEHAGIVFATEVSCDVITPDDARTKAGFDAASYVVHGVYALGLELTQAITRLTQQRGQAPLIRYGQAKFPRLSGFTTPEHGNGR